jgi:hypothetical protein
MRDATGRTRRTSLSRLGVDPVGRHRPTDRPTATTDDTTHTTQKNNGIEYVSLDYVYTHHMHHTQKYMTSHTFAHTRPSRSHTYVRTRDASTRGRSVAPPRASSLSRTNRSRSSCLPLPPPSPAFASSPRPRSRRSPSPPRRSRPWKTSRRCARRSPAVTRIARSAVGIARWRVSFERARGRGDAIARRRALAMDEEK